MTWFELVLWSAFVFNVWFFPFAYLKKDLPWSKFKRVVVSQNFVDRMPPVSSIVLTEDFRQWNVQRPVKSPGGWTIEFWKAKDLTLVGSQFIHNYKEQE